MAVFSPPPPPPAVPTEDDATLVSRVRSGDPRALDSLLARYQGPLLRYSLRMCGGDEEEAKDVLQDSLLSAAQHLDSFRGEAKLSTWLFTIARRFCFRRRRRSKFAPTEVKSMSPGMPEPAHPGPAPEDEMASRELMDALERALSGLDQVNREIMVLRDVEGFTAAEVAAVVGLTEPQIKSRLHRARVAVRKAMSEAVAGPGETTSAPAAASPPPACPDIDQAFSRFLEADIDPNMCAELERHVANCARCRGACDALKRTLAVCRAVPEPEVPEALQASVRRAIEQALRQRPVR